QLGGGRGSLVVPYRKSCTRPAGPRGRWLRCSSSEYANAYASSSRLASGHDVSAGHAHDFRYGTLAPEHDLPFVAEVEALGQRPGGQAGHAQDLAGDRDHEARAGGELHLAHRDQEEI